MGIVIKRANGLTVNRRRRKVTTAVLPGQYFDAVKVARGVWELSGRQLKYSAM